jgi:predicted CDP-diglyceride synthetase/phosphatidate cytidylyltransferase
MFICPETEYAHFHMPMGYTKDEMITLGSYLLNIILKCVFLLLILFMMITLNKYFTWFLGQNLSSPWSLNIFIVCVNTIHRQEMV